MNSRALQVSRKLIQTTSIRWSHVAGDYNEYAGMNAITRSADINTAAFKNTDYYPVPSEAPYDPEVLCEATDICPDLDDAAQPKVQGRPKLLARMAKFNIFKRKVEGEVERAAKPTSSL